MTSILEFPTALAINFHAVSTTLIVATSPDLPGLYVAGRTRDLVMDELPGAIAEMDAVRGRVQGDVA